MISIFSEFEELCRERMRFLEVHYGFEIVNVEKDAYGVYIFYQNQRTFVRASLEPREGGIFISLGRLIDGRIPPYPIHVRPKTVLHSFDLNDLIALRSPNTRLPLTFIGALLRHQIAQALRESAKALQMHADDVLKGDFEVFDLLDRVVKARAKALNTVD